MQLPKANKGGSAPEIEGATYPGKLVDIKLVEHEDWAAEADKFGNPDTGERYHFQATPYDAEGNPILRVVDGEVVYEDGDPVELVLDMLTRTATGPKSGFAAAMKGILTPAEFKKWQADEPVDVQPGRDLLMVVDHNTKGWPQITDFMPPLGRAKSK